MLCGECEKYNRDYKVWDEIVSCKTDSKGIHFIEWQDGELAWVNKEDRFHREEGPAYISESGEESWFLDGVRPFSIEQELYVGKTFECEIEGIADRGMAVVIEKINKFFYRVLIGDEKKLVVSLDKYKG